MRCTVLVLFCVFGLSCRDVQPVEQAATIEGYQLHGTVTAANGAPLDSVEVRLYYIYNVVQQTPIDTQLVVVTDSTKILDISVYTLTYRFIRELYFGYRRTGVIPRFRWDGRDTEGVPVPSGKYFIRYLIDTVVVKYSPVVVDGNPTAFTDASGHFTIRNDSFPIRELFDLYNAENLYIGTYEVLPVIDLEFRKLNLRRTYRVELTRDRATPGMFTLS